MEITITETAILLEEEVQKDSIFFFELDSVKIYASL